MKRFNIAIVGLGGQGIITAGTILKTAVLNSNLHDVSGSERRGGAQREGYVEAFVKYIFYDSISQLKDPRKNIHSPIIPSGGADVLISLEPVETLRAASYLNSNSSVIFNTSPHLPISVRMGKDSYPEIRDIITKLDNITNKIYCYDFDKISIDNFNSLTPRNILALGVLFSKTSIPIPKETIEDILAKGPQPENNLKAFSLGLAL
jgi:indolepyruvate ferredoxin oxidoreductase beta subunit